MEKSPKEHIAPPDEPITTIEEIRAHAPKKGAMVNTMLNSAGNALMVGGPTATILRYACDPERYCADAKKKVTRTPYIVEKLGDVLGRESGEALGRKICAHQGRIAVGIGAVLGIGGLALGLRDDSQLKKYRSLKHKYELQQDNLIAEQDERLTHQEKELAGLKATLKDHGWANRISGEAPSAERGR